MIAVPLPLEGLVDELAGPGVLLDRAADQLDRASESDDPTGAVLDCSRRSPRRRVALAGGRRSGSGRLPWSQPYMAGS